LLKEYVPLTKALTRKGRWEKSGTGLMVEVLVASSISPPPTPPKKIKKKIPPFGCGGVKEESSFGV
jgi:hypothetical protein